MCWGDGRLWIGTYWDPIIYIHTKFGEDVIIGGGVIPSKKNLKNASWQQNFTSSSNFHSLSLAGTFVCVIMQNFSQIGRLFAELYRFYQFTLWGHFPTSVGESWLLYDAMSSGPPRVFTPNSILVRSAFFAQWSRIDDRLHLVHCMHLMQADNVMSQMPCVFGGVWNSTAQCSLVVV